MQDVINIESGEIINFGALILPSLLIKKKNSIMLVLNSYKLHISVQSIFNYRLIYLSINDLPLCSWW